jgi:hypothetical protein
MTRFVPSGKMCKIGRREIENYQEKKKVADKEILEIIIYF